MPALVFTILQPLSEIRLVNSRADSHDLPKNSCMQVPGIYSGNTGNTRTLTAGSLGRFQGCSSERIHPGEFTDVSDTVCKRDGDSSWGREKASLLALHTKRTNAIR